MKRFAMMGSHLALALLAVGPQLGLDASLCQIGAAYVCTICAALSY